MLFRSKQEHLDLIHLEVSSLGFPKDENPTTDEIYKRIQEFGLELCPAEIGLSLRLQNSTSDSIYIGMKQITDRGGHPSVFFLYRDDGVFWLHGPWATPDHEWHDSSEFVFRLSKFSKRS